MIERKRRILIVDEYSVFHTLVLRVILRVCKNNTSGLEILRAANLSEAIHLLTHEVHPDIVVMRNLMSHPEFEKYFVILAPDPFNQDELAKRIEEILVTKNRRVSA